MTSARQLSPHPIVVEAVVLASMALTTLAVGTALYLQAGIDLLMALGLSLAAYTVMLVAHGLMRRFVFGPTESREQAADVAAMSEDRSEALARKVAEALSTLPREEVRTPRAERGDSRQADDAQFEPSPQFGRRTSVPSGAPTVAPTTERPSASPNVSGVARSVQPAAAAVSRAPAAPAASADKPIASPPQRAPHGALHGGKSKARMPELPAARFTPAPERHVPPPSPPRASDVAMIQALIRKLADEVNATSAAGRMGLPEEPDAFMVPDEPVSALEAEFEPHASDDRPSRPQAAPPPVPASIVAAGVSGNAAPRDLDVSTATEIDALRRAAEDMRALDARASEGPKAVAGEPANEIARDTARADKAAGIVAPVVLGRIGDAVSAGRVDVLLDPVVGLEDSKARHFEVSVRLRDGDGNALDVSQDVEGLRGTGIFPLVDQAKLERTSHLAQRLQARGKTGAVFTRTSGESLIADPFLDTFADAYRARESFASQLIMTFSQSDVRGFGAREWATLADMADLGFGFGIASVSDLDMDFEDLAARGFKFLKLDAGVFLDGLPAGETFVPADDICRHVAALGMTVIVGEIESEAIKARIFGFGVSFGQGALFGGPRLVKSDAVAPRDGHDGMAAA